MRNWVFEIQKNKRQITPTKTKCKIKNFKK